MASSNSVTMGWRCGTWRFAQSSMSEWLADGCGGLRDAFPLIAFGICPPPRAGAADDQRVTTENDQPGPGRKESSLHRPDCQTHPDSRGLDVGPTRALRSERTLARCCAVFFILMRLVRR